MSMKKSGQCAICGAIGPVTREHLPPAKLYSDRERAAIDEMHIVKACLKCNNGGSPDDEHLKILVGMETGEERPHADEVIEHLASTLGNNRRLAHTVFAGQPALTPSGPKIAIEFDWDKYKRSVARMAKGLYFKETGRALGLGAWVSVWTPSSSATAVDVAARSMPRKSLNAGTFSYAHLIFPDRSSMWHLTFFDRHEVLAWTGPPCTEVSTPVSS